MIEFGDVEAPVRAFFWEEPAVKFKREEIWILNVRKFDTARCHKIIHEHLHEAAALRFLLGALGAGGAGCAAGVRSRLGYRVDERTDRMEDMLLRIQMTQALQKDKKYKI